jgi:long-chain acyl-CoA synthetase
MAAGATTAEQGTGTSTLAEMTLEAASRYDGAALKYKEGDDWTEMSWEELGKAVREIAAGLIELGIEPGQRVAIFSDTRAEWTLADLGGIVAGAHVVPIYHTASTEEANHVLEDSESRLVFVENEEKLDTAREASEGLQVEHYVLFEGEDDDAISLEELREKGQGADDSALDERVKNISEDDVFTLIYTSGTTGPPKGCVLTHGNYRSNSNMVVQTVEIGQEDTVFVFLPLAHALTRMTQMVAIDTGVTIAFWERDKEKAMDNLKEVEPTFFPTVPRILEKIAEEAQKQAEGTVKEKLFEKAVEVGRKVREAERNGEEPGPVLKKEHDLADKQVLGKVREVFGSNLRFALTGAAPVAKEMLEFFDACGVLVLEGYGATETSAIATANTEDDFRFGTVGKALPDTEVRIAEDSGDDDQEDDEDEDEGEDNQEEGVGEILIKGPHVFQGYYGLEDETKENFDGEWFKTGDLGSLDDDGFLTVKGRTKEIIVTSSGKNITPTNIEKKIADASGISQAVVYGDDRPYLVALIELEDDSLGEDDVQKAVDDANSDLAKIEQVKKFKILDRELSQDEGELTPTMKIKREKVYENFSEEIDSLYEDDDGGDG